MPPTPLLRPGDFRRKRPVRTHEIRDTLRIGDLSALVGALATAGETGDEERPRLLLRSAGEGIFRTWPA
ncbi:hypothetical protein [Streptomyces sp. NPDC051665]|uniref:hypothetical protein n=1 Tax=Streptomyces sp. NPDC051665 TaxID=3154647 RepID=UPI00341BC744